MIVVETLEGGAPSAAAPSEPDQDRHLMTVGAPPVLQHHRSHSLAAPPRTTDRNGLKTSRDSDHAAVSDARPPRSRAPGSARHRLADQSHPRGLRPHLQPTGPVCDPQIPIAARWPTRPHPSRGFLHVRLSDAGPREATTVV